MLASLARTAARKPKPIAALGLVLFVAFGVFGGPATGLLNATNAFQAPGACPRAIRLPQ